MVLTEKVIGGILDVSMRKIIIQIIRLRRKSESFRKVEAFYRLNWNKNENYSILNLLFVNNVWNNNWLTIFNEFNREVK